jgi:type 1 glutamine amidotransferase
MAGLRVMSHLLRSVPDLVVESVRADEPWPDGPDRIDRVDGVVLYLTQGGQWMRSDPKRYAAIERLASRKGGIVAIHWAVGAKDAAFIETSLRFIGACHGGPDRKYIKSDQLMRIASVEHPIVRGLSEIDVHDEFYYRLKQTKVTPGIVPLLTTTIDQQEEVCAWAWERPDAGRSFGFVGLHFHRNWELASYRRLITHAILWTLDLPIPEAGQDVECPAELLALPAKS